MDANGLRFWMLASDARWNRWGDPAHVHYDGERRSLRLASERVGVVWPDRMSDATSALERIPRAMDAFDTLARWDPDTGAVMASGALPGETPIVTPTGGEAPSDLAMGYDGILYMAVGGRVVMVDRRDRWVPVSLAAAGFTAWRLAPDPGGGAWVLDRTGGRLGRVSGQPLPGRPAAVPAPSTFRPCEENPDPPRLSIEVAATVPGNEMLVAIACGPDGQVGVLTWVADADARVRRVVAGGYAAPVTLLGARHPFSLAWRSATEVVVLLAGVAEAPAYDVVTDAGVNPIITPPLGDLYPLRDHDGGPFVHRPGLPPRYATTTSTAALHRLSLPSFAQRGEASNRDLIDSGSAQTVWHRIYLEADLPPSTAVTVWLAATNEAAAPIAEDAWHEHRFRHGVPAGDASEVPQAAWISAPSELPFHPGLLVCAPVKNRTGLFTALVQRAGRRVRSLRGRFLWVHVELTGDGRSSPEVAALRLYGSRFSYLDRYLPELYRESVFGPDAEVVAPATGADFLERLLDTFESVLTPLEDRIAGAYLLTDARTTPDDALEWLGTWIGVGFDPVYPSERRRRLLHMAPALYRWRGTARGLAAALEVATDGGVSGGEIVVLEDFRLRRTLVTILGADLADEDDPLLAGLVASGNSYVGDTLFLGDETRQEFLALFAADLPRGLAEQAAIDAFLDGLAYRVTVLVHQEVLPQDLGLIRRVVELETPAHVLARVITASQPFVIGMAALVGADTYLGPPLARRGVEVGRSRVGLRDVLEHLPSLDPRLEGAAPAPAAVEAPTAQLDAPATAESGDAFLLDGRRSRAARGRHIDRYRWRMLQ